MNLIPPFDSEESRMRRDLLGVVADEYGVIWLMPSTPVERLVLPKETLEVCDAEAHISFSAGINELSGPSPTALGRFLSLAFDDDKDDRLLLKVSLKASI